MTEYFISIEYGAWMTCEKSIYDRVIANWWGWNNTRVAMVCLDSDTWLKSVYEE